MPAPDLPPPPDHESAPRERALHVHLHADHVESEELAGCVVIVIDAIRASTTICVALAHGAEAIAPVLSAEEARRRAAEILEREPGKRVLLGGERGGVLIEGFDLDNSPSSYTRERVAGRTIVFTTSNGTAALLHARRAEKVLVGCFANLSAVCAAVAGDERPVHILCCGTREDVSLDDVLAGGAMVERLCGAGRRLTSDDGARVAMLAWKAASAGGAAGVVEAMRASRGGRNMVQIGLGTDVDFCARIDTAEVVPRFEAGLGLIGRENAATDKHR